MNTKANVAVPRQGPDSQLSGVPTRRRRPGWMWGGLAAVVVSAVGFTVIVSAAGDRSDVLVLARDVQAGHELKPGDLRSVKVAAETGVVPYEDRRGAVGKRARVPLVGGSLLAPGQVGGKADFPPKGASQVTVPVEEGGAAPDLARGERVALLPGPSGQGEVTGESAGGGKDEGESSAGTAVVGTVSGVKKAKSSGSSGSVTVLVETAAVRRAAALDNPRVVVLPSEGREAP